MINLNQRMFRPSEMLAKEVPTEATKQAGPRVKAIAES